MVSGCVMWCAGVSGLACAVVGRFLGGGVVGRGERAAARRGRARTLCFSEFLDPSGDVGAQLQALTGAAPAVQLEWVGAPGVLQACIDRAPAKGVIMGIGDCDHPDQIVPLKACVTQLRIQGAVGFTKEDSTCATALKVARLAAANDLTHRIDGLQARTSR